VSRNNDFIVAPVGRDGEAGVSLAASRWGGPVEAVSEALLEDAGLAVDASFGAGLNRDLDGKAKAIVEAMQGRASMEALTVTSSAPSRGTCCCPGGSFTAISGSLILAFPSRR
jgi:NAD(P)H-hydrate repair Nnr-like enzyme with NAD(P)H-hydrate epimerase domain